jgi:hypothetical protein
LTSGKITARKVFQSCGSAILSSRLSGTEPPM